MSIICLLALWACVEYCLSFISRPGLLGGVRHLIITALRALSLHLQNYVKRCAIGITVAPLLLRMRKQSKMYEVVIPAVLAVFQTT